MERASSHESPAGLLREQGRAKQTEIYGGRSLSFTLFTTSRTLLSRTSHKTAARKTLSTMPHFTAATHCILFMLHGCGVIYIIF